MTKLLSTRITSYTMSETNYELTCSCGAKINLILTVGLGPKIEAYKKEGE